MATSTWRWRRITRAKAQWIAPTEFLVSAKRAITCKRFRTRTLGPAPAACPTRSSTPTPSTGTSHPKAASYLRTTEAGRPQRVPGLPFSVLNSQLRISEPYRIGPEAGRAHEIASPEQLGSFRCVESVSARQVLERIV